MIKAFKQIVKDYPKLNLLILGEGEERNKLEKLVKKLNLENKIFLIVKPNIYKYLKKSEDLF